jgi:hypothetical protein
MRVDQVLHSEQTPFQRMEIYKSNLRCVYGFGMAMFSCGKDELLYD